MKHNYSETSTCIVPCMLDDETAAAIGRIVRAVAELEALLSVYIQVAGRLSEGHAFILLGRAAISRKIDIARTFAASKDVEASRNFRETFGSETLQAVLEVRNIVAHSTLIGQTIEGDYAFKTTKILSVASDEAIIEAVTLATSDLHRAASDAERMVVEFPGKLKVAQAFARRGADMLNPHTKARPSEGR